MYFPLACGSKNSSRAQLKLSIYSKEISAIYLFFLDSSHLLLEASKPKVGLTDSETKATFFQTK